MEYLDTTQMNLNYNLIEGNDAVYRAILMMKYDLTKTLTENNISEQYTITLEQTNPLEISKVIGAPLILTDYMIRHYISRLYNWVQTFNSHDWLTAIQVAAGIGVIVSGPFAPIFYGIGVAAAFYDSVKYFEEGDPYMGTITMALALIPGGVAKGIFQGSKVFLKRGTQGSLNLIKKYKSGAKMTKEQLKDVSRIVVDFTKKSSQVNLAMGVEVSKRLLAGLAKQSPKFLVNLILFLNKIGVLNLSKFVINFGGTIYTFDKIYLYVFRDTIFADKKYLDSRTLNQTRFIINGLLGYDKEVMEYLVLFAENHLKKLTGNNNNKLQDANITEKATEEYIDSVLKKIRNKSNTKVVSNKPLKPLNSSNAPTLNDVLLGKKVIEEGQKGDSVTEIQKMLYSIGYDYLIARDENPKWNDGNYGNNTKMAVIAFQENNDLKINGIVDMKTLNKLIKFYNENNEK